MCDISCFVVYSTRFTCNKEERVTKQHYKKIYISMFPAHLAKKSYVIFHANNAINTTKKEKHSCDIYLFYKHFCAI